jgi:hypothetical protein
VIRRCFPEGLTGFVFLSVLSVTAAFAKGAPLQNRVRPPEIAKWQALVPAIETTLTLQGLTCTDGTIRIGIVDAAEFAGLSVALVKYCPGGAYTDWIVAMQLEKGEPVRIHFRKMNGEVGDLEFAQGASVMHGKSAKLVPKNSAIYDISWDNDGLDKNGVIKPQKCVVDAYVLNTKSKIFEWDADLTKQAARSYCQDLAQRAH